MTRVLIRVPATASRGEVIEIRTLIQHPMETGYRPDAAGRLLARDIITRFTCPLDSRLVFEATLHPAIAANPYLTFTLRAETSGVLAFAWEGDHGFRHGETRALTVT